ncbi:hypothetical protein Pcac1_g9932 [Phytophthora cactorum]|uniref:Uncharacterized protein n=1 Tax=Phytophthora cactorum TaxID=29920 RepID=A0A329SID3_9STRA|nr:hypothetical protein Pcac1_g9932 [Phytophthora cactorum]KAG2955531.1 hypothetical protein PC117_g320 [Phytophthora cactorum]KAG3103329.1 hypothetical protein PC121_g981 [Phytophthora cactorum]RAW35876.1 hypothetical protein PC110_g7840 [Phytophthora cactorum]
MEPSELDETPLDVDDAGEDEEEVEIFSADATASAHSHAPSSDRTSLLPPAPRRCVSKEMLEQMPTLSINTRYHEVTVRKPFGCFHLMQLIEKSIQVGALFSPKLFVPKEIWQQDRVKLAGVPLKVEVFHQLKQGLEKTSHALPLSSDTAKAAFIKELDALLEFARQERVHLIRSFPFLPQDKSHAAPQLTRRGSSSVAEEGSADAHSSGIGKLTNLAFGFGRMVKKQAIAAVERVGAAPSVSVSIDELDEYAAVLCMFFNSTRSIENLLGLRADADGTQEQVNDPKAETESSQLDPATLKKLEDLAIFLDEVVIELVMRDVHSLLELYMRRLTRQFGEFTVEQAVLKRHPSISA